MQPVPRRQKHDRRRRRLLHAHPRRLARDLPRVHRHEPAQRSRRQRHHLFPHSKPLDSLPHRSDHSRALPSQRHRRPGVHSQRCQHVPEVQTRRLDFDLHLASPRSTPRRLYPPKLVQPSGLRRLQSLRHRALHSPALLRRFHQPRHIPPAAPIPNLRLVIPRAELPPDRFFGARSAAVQIQKPAAQLRVLLHHHTAQSPQRRRPRRHRLPPLHRLRSSRHPPHPRRARALAQRLHQMQTGREERLCFVHRTGARLRIGVSSPQPYQPLDALPAPAHGIQHRAKGICIGRIHRERVRGEVPFAHAANCEAAYAGCPQSRDHGFTQRRAVGEHHPSAGRRIARHARRCLLEGQLVQPVGRGRLRRPKERR